MGVFAMCLFIAGKREDEALERCRMKRKEIIDHGVCICFVNSQGEELFRLADGESLVQNAPNGERNVSTCHYLDADSAMIDGKKWNLLEFAKEMEKRGIMLSNGLLIVSLHFTVFPDQESCQHANGYGCSNNLFLHIGLTPLSGTRHSSIGASMIPLFSISFANSRRFHFFPSIMADSASR